MIKKEKKESFLSERSSFPRSTQKKGISAVVATVLIILITVAAVTIIWAAVIPMIKNQISGGTACLDAVSQVSIVTDGGYTCKNEENISLQISHGAKDFDLADVQVLISASGNTYTTYLSNDSVSSSTDMPGMNEEKVYTLNISEISSELNSNNVDKIEIAPIVAIGNTEETCDVAAEAVLNDC